MKLKNLKLTGVLALLLAMACGLSSCSLFGGDKKKQKPVPRTGSSFLTGDSPVLGSDSPSLGTSKERR